MSSKHFIDDPTHLVHTALSSIPLTNPSVAFDADNKVIYRAAATSSSGSSSNDKDATVSLISGGGSGHEPSFAAFVGRGLLTGAVAGSIFASPSAEQVRNCITQRVGREKGVLVVVMNYTGDVLNFGMAVEKAKATKGFEAGVDMVVVGDDVGVGRQKGGKVGRRGIAGTVLLLKIAGALAESGASLEEVTSVAQLVSNNLISIGSSLSYVHVPGRSTATSPDDLSTSEVEIGMGIHNEPGSERVDLSSLPDLVTTMLAHLLDAKDQDRNFLADANLDSDEFVLLVNNLGSVSVLELGGIVYEVVTQLRENWKIAPKRVISGTFMTSLNGLGFSITLLRLKDTGLGAGKSILELLDAPAEATGWTSGSITSNTWANAAPPTQASSAPKQQTDPEAEQQQQQQQQSSNFQQDPVLAKSRLAAAMDAVIKAEPDVTNYDTILGDGDCGIGLKRGADAILKLLDRTKQDTLSDPLALVAAITKSVETNMDGTSGALYAIFLNALVGALGTLSSGETSKTDITAQTWAKALRASLEALSKYTPARVGDRTLVDALVPFVEELENSGDVNKAAARAKEGAEHTQHLKASLGRAVYVGGDGFQGVPDPGAHGLAELFLGLAGGA